MDFTPAVYEHAAFLIDKTPWEASRDPELIFQGHRAAFEQYRHTPVVVGIDIYNLEAEAYGATIEPPRGTGIPAIERPILSSAAELKSLAPLDAERDGRIPMMIDVARRLAAAMPDADVRIPVSGPFSIASNLVGFETLLCDVLGDAENAAAGLMHLVEGQVRFAQVVREAGLDVAFFESAACPPLLSPAMFRQIELPALKAVMQGVAQVVGHPVPCIIGGNTAPILDDMLATGTGYVICPIETDQQAFMRIIWDRTDVRVRVNTSAQLMVSGTREQLREEVARIRRLVGDRPNVCVGTGAMPYETPPENVHYLAELCAEAG
jgi:uroporphyrinogen decarboxylase